MGRVDTPRALVQSGVMRTFLISAVGVLAVVGATLLNLASQLMIPVLAILCGLWCLDAFGVLAAIGVN